MILRVLWFASVFCVSVWIGAHWEGRPAAVRPADPAALLPFDPVAVIGRPFHELARVLNGHG